MHAKINVWWHVICLINQKSVLKSSVCYDMFYYSGFMYNNGPYVIVISVLPILPLDKSQLRLISRLCIPVNNIP